MRPIQIMRLRNKSGGGASAFFQIVTWTGAGGASHTAASLDLSNGGMVWVKRTDSTGSNNVYFKRASGATVYSYANETTVPPVASSATLDNTGFTVPDDISGATYIAWVFKKQANCFDIVDYTGTGSVTTVAHSLGEIPGMIVVGRYTGTSSKVTLQAGISAANRGVLNNSGGIGTDNTYWNSTSPTSSVFTVGTNTNTNATAANYFAFLFGNNTSTVACGSYAGSLSAVDVTIGFQPRLLVMKSTTGSRDWIVEDQTRSPGFAGNEDVLRWNTTAASSGGTGGDNVSLISNGVRLQPAGSINTNGETFVYLAIS